ncbi:FKBP-type peptidyl-prolyl cis-trans isomerase, partial [Shewanella sp. 0m-11]
GPGGSEIPGMVRDVVGDSVTIDLNHPLAGQVLTFELEVVQVL